MGKNINWKAKINRQDGIKKIVSTTSCPHAVFVSYKTYDNLIKFWSDEDAVIVPSCSISKWILLNSVQKSQQMITSAPNSSIEQKILMIDINQNLKMVV